MENIKVLSVECWVFSD